MDGGPFQAVLDNLRPLANNLWFVLVELTIMAAMIGGIWHVLSAAGGSVIGGNKYTATAIIGLAGLILMVIVVFVLVPELGEIIKGMKPVPPF
jgi:hypothetical protein